MDLVKKAVAYLVVIAGVFFTPVSAHCEETAAEREIMVISGTVTAIDWVGSVLVLDGDERYIVPDGTKVFKSDDTIGFGGINIGDSVKIKYYEDPDGNNVVKNIEVAYSGDI